MTTSLWQDLPRDDHPRLDHDARVDVLVIGGGMSGASAAYHAAARGADAMLLEAGAIASGASGRNAGFLLAAPQAHYAESVALHGRELARDVWRLNRRNRDGVVALAERLGIACDIEATGSVVAAVDAEEAVLLRRSADLMREDGLVGAVLDADATREATGGVGFHGGLLASHDGQFHPVLFVRGLVAKARERGARVHEHAPVAKLERTREGWLARTDAGHVVRARTVVAGLNAYAPRLLAFARDRVHPVRGQVFSARLLSGPAPARPVYADRGYLYVRTHGDRLLAGGMRHLRRADEVGFVDEVNAELQTAIEGAVHAHWPGARWETTHRWSGVMGFSRDGLPWIGAVPGEPGLFAWFGCTGHGWGYGVWAGEVLADLATGRDAEVPRWCSMGRPLVPERLVS